MANGSRLAPGLGRTVGRARSRCRLSRVLIRCDGWDEASLMRPNPWFALFWQAARLIANLAASMCVSNDFRRRLPCDDHRSPAADAMNRHLSALAANPLPWDYP